MNKLVNFCVTFTICMTSLSVMAEPIHDAAGKGDIAKIRALLQEGVNANAQDNNKRMTTPLHHAALAGQDVTIHVLLQAGANVNARDSFELTPLHYAATMNHIKIIKILLQAGANVNARDNFELTPLHYAVEKSHVETIHTLLQAGANANARSAGCSPVDIVRYKIKETEKPVVPFQKIIRILREAGGQAMCQ